MNALKIITVQMLMASKDAQNVWSTSVDLRTLCSLKMHWSVQIEETLTKEKKEKIQVM